MPIGEVSAEEAQAHLADLTALGGVILTRYTTRFYPNGGVAPQVVGYGTASRRRVGRLPGAAATPATSAWAAPGWKPGASNIWPARAAAPCTRHHAGGQTTKLAESAVQPAQAIYTTLDRELQMHAQQALDGFRGSVIVMNPSDGEVLAMASSPAYDPNLFDPTNRNSAAWTAVLADAAQAAAQPRRAGHLPARLGLQGGHDGRRAALGPVHPRQHLHLHRRLEPAGADGA